MSAEWFIIILVGSTTVGFLGLLYFMCKYTCRCLDYYCCKSTPNQANGNANARTTNPAIPLRTISGNTGNHNSNAGNRTSTASNPTSNRGKTVATTSRPSGSVTCVKTVETSAPRVSDLIVPKVTVPSGETFNICSPAKKCTCKKLSATILLPLAQTSDRIIRDVMDTTIASHISGSYSEYNIILVQRIVNCCLWTKYTNRLADLIKEAIDVNQQMLFHGSRAVDQIVQEGFDERFSNDKGMFGAGIYFAEHSSKSNQYVFGYMNGSGCSQHQDTNCCLCVRKILLCRVSLGNVQRLTSAKQLAHAPPGYHSVAGEPTPTGLKYPEYVIYRGEQAYPEYLITYKIVK